MDEEQEPMLVEQIEINKIFIGPRGREEFGNMESLKLSIMQYGILVPIIVKKTDNEYELVAGERRLTCCKELGMTEIPAVIKENIDAFTQKELELEENLKRKDLTWIEKFNMMEEIHQMGLERYGDALPGRFGKSGWTQKDTAEKLSLSEASISISLNMAEEVRRYPQLKGCKTLREAKRQLTLLKRGEKMELTEVARRVKECVEQLKIEESFTRIERASVDLLITDIEEYFHEDLIRECARVMNLTSHGFLFFPIERMMELFDLLDKYNFVYEKKPYIWHVKGPDDYQTFYWVSKNLKAPPKGLKRHMSYRQDKDILHTKQVPYALYEHVVGQASYKDAFVYDPNAYGVELTRVCIDSYRKCRVNCPSKTLYEQMMMKIEEEGMKK